MVIWDGQQRGRSEVIIKDKAKKYYYKFQEKKSMKIRLVFDKPDLLPTGRDAIEYLFRYKVIDEKFVGKPEEDSETKHYRIKVSITGTLDMMWKLSDFDREKVLYEFGKRHVEEKIKEGSLIDNEELWLSTSTHPKSNPFNPSKIQLLESKVITISTRDESMGFNHSALQLGSKIINSRDNINAVFQEKYGNKLLQMNQERSLYEFVREVHSQEEFSYRLSSLAELASNFNVKILKTIVANDSNGLKSISLLERYLKKIDGANLHCIEILRNIRALRKGYPTHGDNLKDVLAAHRFFMIEYPIENYELAWNMLLVNYSKVLEMLLEAVRKDYQVDTE